MIEQHRLYVLLACFALSIFPKISFSTDIITPVQSLREGQTLVSASKIFELGFFNPSAENSSTTRYLGIWFKNIPLKTVVWVANRENPITESSGVLAIDTKRKLLLLQQSNRVIWQSGSWKAVETPVLQL